MAVSSQAPATPGEDAYIPNSDFKPKNLDWRNIEILALLQEEVYISINANKYGLR